MVLLLPMGVVVVVGGAGGLVARVDAQWLFQSFRVGTSWAVSGAEEFLVGRVVVSAVVCVSWVVLLLAVDAHKVVPGAVFVGVGPSRVELLFFVDVLGACSGAGDLRVGVGRV